MRALLDTCVLYPPVLREILMAVAGAGLFDPLWSARTLEEWQRRADRDGKAEAILVAGEIARLTAFWPMATVSGYEAIEARIGLPDPADKHVLAAAIAGRAVCIVTANLRDFPRRVLAVEAIRAIHPDAFLRGLWDQAPKAVADAVARVLADAQAMSGTPIDRRAILKRARLPRLAKALEGQGQGWSG